jgi:hypothetical protein
MKTKLEIETNSPDKILLLIKVAKEMGIDIKETGNNYHSVNDEVSIVSEPSLSEAWLSKEDERWDNLYSK